MSRSTGALSLVNRAALSGVVLVMFLGVVGLAFWASQRQERGSGGLASTLSLQFLELSVAVKPRDESLRMKLARKRFETGQLERARELVLRECRDPVQCAEADRLLVEIDFARLMSVPFGDRSERERRMADLRWTLENVIKQNAGQELLLRIGALYRELELPAQAAALFDQLARSTEKPEARRIELADQTWLDAGQPLAASELHAYWARQGGAEGLMHARLALERSRLEGGSLAALTPLLKQMRELYPQDIDLLKLAFRIAETSDVRRAYDIALELSRLQPGVAQHHRDAARLAEASGKMLCALDQYMWLWRRDHRADDKQHALHLARESSDLQVLRELLDGTPASASRAHKGCSRRRRARARVCHGAEPSERDMRLSLPQPTPPQQPQPQNAASDWDERYQLYEALGDTQALRTLLGYIVSTGRGNTVYWWRRKLALERRLDDNGAALQSLTQLLRLAPESNARDEIADLQLALGDARAALGTLQATPIDRRDGTLLRNVCELAAAVGDIDAERSAYEEVVHSEHATLSDYQRLLALAPDESSASRISAEAAVRYGSYDMFSLAYTLAKRAGDESAQLELLKRVELLDGIARRVEYWQVRVALQQERAARAERAKNYDAAKHALSRADDLLHYAAKTAPGKEQYAGLWGAQHAQALSLGLASGDRSLALRAFLATRSSLGARERVYLLIKLGQPDQALEEAKRQLGSGQLRDSDRDVLESSADSLTRGRATDLQLQGTTLSMDGLQALGASARIDYAAIEGGLRIHVGYTEYDPVSSLSSLLMDPVHDLFGSIRGRIGPIALEAGANVRDAEQIRPFGIAHAQLLGDEERGASLQGQVNVQNTDNARLRVFGTMDEVAFKTTFGFAKYLWTSIRTTGDAYYTLADRHFLGYGGNGELGFGSSHELPANIGTISVRAFGRGALRLARKTAPDAAPDVWLPESFVWSGVGGSIARGQLNAPPLFGRQVSYALDAAGGYLYPMKKPGWTVVGQLGISCFGADSLLFSASAGNILGTSGIAGNVAYIVSFAD